MRKSESALRGVLRSLSLMRDGGEEHNNTSISSMQQSPQPPTSYSCCECALTKLLQSSSNHPKPRVVVMGTARPSSKSHESTLSMLNKSIGCHMMPLAKLHNRHFIIAQKNTNKRTRMTSELKVHGHHCHHPNHHQNQDQQLTMC